jgi:hypothetical protein
MPVEKHTPDEIIGKLRKAEIVLAQDWTTAVLSKQMHLIEIAG